MLSVCVSVPAPKPKASLALELISDCRLAWTPEGYLFRCHLGCEQARALDEVGEAAGWTWGGQPGLDAGNNDSLLVERLQVSRQGSTCWEDPGPGEWIPDRTRTRTVTFSNCSQNQETQRWLP